MAWVWSSYYELPLTYISCWDAFDFRMFQMWEAYLREFFSRDNKIRLILRWICVAKTPCKYRKNLFHIVWDLFSTQKFIHFCVNHNLCVINYDSSIVTGDFWVFPLMKALVSSSHHILWGMIGIGFWQSFSKAKSTLPLHCVKISIAFNVVASRVAKNNFIAKLFDQYYSTSGQNLKTGSWLFCHETDHFSVPNNGKIGYKKICCQKIAGSMA